MKPYLLSTLIVLSSTAFANDLKSGGDTSVKKEGPNAFSLPAANLPMSKRLDFSVGNSFFRNPWVSALNLNGCT